ncbi:MAG: peptidase S9 [SAR86 cluster bacterium]|uniref:Peptidase S9 n=1 Tax=SAR86 cluster bacterium TaxID=2030880 RepID=A0A2A4XAE7_9GAMM|nr:MAG: peptidase S9 [SAR86 cluster bacterium]
MQVYRRIAMLKRAIINSFILSASLIVMAVNSYASESIDADVVYGHKDGMALVYDVIKPAEPNGAAIVFMVSGGWYSRWAPPENRAEQFAYMLDEGFTVIPVHHGSAPRYYVPEAYADVSRAIRHIKMHGDRHGIDTNRIGVFGGSAGGHLSLMLGLNSDQGKADAQDEVMRQDNSVAAVVAYFPPVDLREITGPNDRFPALNFSQDKAAAISPILYADAGDPPTLLIHGDADELVNISNSEIMHAEFKKQSVTSEFITIPGAGHGFRGEDADTAAAASLAWFTKYLL